ncbi:ATP-binding protein [Aliarcobacter butzleri]|uniref:AAA family ATPase n=1 Tax=Aliarcobacter butzleri TaxID=28197 RepID=UPI0021B3081E|nr:ATP-binding protein [Aliarcobacter butzleri]MCT7610126.1 ATP-binding protein [Aliarcobacter butzleri]
MELVYLWVKNHKNIVEQGFNFSRRFRCHYDKEKNELEIIDKDETGEFYPKNFFGDNINVTAIVGENGSGKSSILEFLVDEIAKNGIILYFENEKFFITKDITLVNYKSETITNSSLKSVYIEKNFLRYIYITNFFDILNSGTQSIYKNLLSEKVNSTKLDLSEFKKGIFEKIKKHNNLFKNDLFNFNPIKVVFHKIKDSEELEENEKKEILIETYNNLKKEIFIDENVQILNNEWILFEKGIIGIDYIDKDARKYYDLSDGEKTIFTDLLIIYDELSQDNDKKFIVLDEPNNSFHPLWQQKYIKELVSIISKFDRKVHIIITSHSPFILSDLPKENIIFLEKGKQVYPFEDGKQTFGANIHTLLSHGFFMKDGLMGEFAKDKIDTAIKYLNQKILTEDELNYCENIISIIGEPIIKRELQRKLDSKGLSKIDKIEEIEEQMKLLQNRLEMIRKNQK